MLFNVHSFISNYTLGNVSILNGSVENCIESSSLPEDVKFEVRSQLSNLVVSGDALPCLTSVSLVCSD